ncbi:helix-turn-helix domain-containing protein [Enterococcus cecorum]|uniref:helix-turn-helix domain-containing protein n=3 Tax=Enterococcus cecorum TaxID=44008 RepID=UPI001FAD7BB3|nr:Rgg/GadR/MutR family transcriptional regulator [Enterococcus cecorum]MCJ0537595.1 Rgg/GadR/MutR family transcriptional regulator [Enterococcus cecorum]MCJ0547278.1 Rgg/GadR/MutR family transcriptional regulator [Enterococcus cecorum]MCJ0551011.1 Rgg/GadR/MutR family transcriptional regulator [Enterococcus cecorum]
MEDFGKIFKKYRESRQLKLRDIASKELSTSQISRFENGESDLTITKFMHAIQLINMPIDEFMYTANNFKLDELNELLNKIVQYTSSRDIENLKRLIFEEESKECNNATMKKIRVLLIKIHLYDLFGEKLYQEEDIHFLADYLFSIEYWGRNELLIFSNAIVAFNTETNLILLREMNRRTDFYKDIPQNRSMIASMNVNAYIFCVENSEWIEAQYFEQQLKETYFKETEIYERLVFIYAKAFHDYKKNKDEKALNQLYDVIKAMKLAGSIHLAKNFEEHLNKILQLNE